MSTVPHEILEALIDARRALEAVERNREHIVKAAAPRGAVRW